MVFKGWFLKGNLLCSMSCLVVRGPVLGMYGDLAEVGRIWF